MHENLRGESANGALRRRQTRRAYLSYTAMAQLPRQSVEDGLAMLEKADDGQSERLAIAFSSAAQVLMEIKGYSLKENRVELESGEAVDTEIFALRTDALKRGLPSNARNFLTHTLGPVDDIELSVAHIPILVSVLVELRGPFEAQRRSLNIEKILAMKLSGDSTVTIAEALETNTGRVKGLLHRFTTTIEEKLPIGERNELLRERLTNLDMFQERHVPTSQEIDDKLPPYAPRNNKHYGPRKSKSTRVAGQSRVSDRPLSAPPLSYQSQTFTAAAFPDDLLPGETMSERRLRLREEARRAQEEQS